MVLPFHYPQWRWMIAAYLLPGWLLLGAAGIYWISRWSRPAPIAVSPTDNTSSSSVNLTTSTSGTFGSSGGGGGRGGMDDYRAIWARSLRQTLIEVKPATPDPQPQDQGLHYVLLGTAVEGHSSFAMLRDDHGAIRIVSLGSVLEGFQVHSIEAERVGFLRDGQQIYLLLPENLRRTLPHTAQSPPATAIATDKPFVPAAPPDPSAPPPPPLQLQLRAVTSNQFMQDVRLVPAAAPGTGQFGQQAGFRMDSIANGSPLLGAGLRPGDVIVALDGKELTRLSDLEHLYASLDATEPHEWKVRRGERWLTVQLNPQEKSHDPTT